MKIAAAGLLIASALHAQQFTWQGEVPGVVVLHVQGRKVEVEYRKGPPVQGARFHFSSALPESRLTVRLDVREGRGSVRVLHQPDLDDAYSADILIEDLQDGAGFYSIALDWDAGARMPSGRLDRLKWSGTVTGEARVECRASVCSAKVEQGEPVSRQRFKFSRPLPAAELPVTLDETGGKADIRLVQQPSARNGYTAGVLVRPLAGSTACSFVLSWERPAARW